MSKSREQIEIDVLFRFKHFVEQERKSPQYEGDETLDQLSDFMILRYADPATVIHKGEDYCTVVFKGEEYELPLIVADMLGQTQINS